MYHTQAIGVISRRKTGNLHSNSTPIVVCQDKINGSATVLYNISCVLVFTTFCYSLVLRWIFGILWGQQPKVCWYAHVIERHHSLFFCECSLHLVPATTRNAGSKVLLDMLQSPSVCCMALSRFAFNYVGGQSGRRIGNVQQVLAIKWLKRRVNPYIRSMFFFIWFSKSWTSHM